MKTGARYALKHIKKENGQVPEEVQEEVKVLSTVSHPFVLQMVKSFETKTNIYILTELITGGQLCKQMKDKMGPVSSLHARGAVLILEALHVAGVVYRDLKPENVDFGAAKKMLDGSKTFPVVGTVKKHGEEEIFGDTGYSLEADFRSLGVLFYEMVCGKLPFGNDLEEDHIISAIMEEELFFPPKYNDNAGKTGKTLIERFLTKNPKGSALEGLGRGQR